MLETSASTFASVSASASSYMDSIMLTTLAQEVGAGKTQVQAAVNLLDSGATVPFIARYRKEATGGLDDVQLRLLEGRLTYLREMQARRTTILASIEGQGKLTQTLRAALLEATTKQALEDLYLPYKPKRRSKGLIAREAGLEPLADALLADPGLVPEDVAHTYVLTANDNPEGGDFTTVAAVLDGVRDLLAERWAEDATLVQGLREWVWHHGFLHARKADSANEAQAEVAKFRDYFDYQEALSQIPSHRALAVFRGRSLGFLEASMVLPLGDDPKNPHALAEARIAQHIGWRDLKRPADALLLKCIRWAWRVKLALSLERDVFSRLREGAEKVAIDIFAQNLKHLLLAAPAGKRVVMGLDPGIRTGVKVAVVDATGKVLDTATVYPHEPRRDWDGSLYTLAKLCQDHGVTLIAIGNGTASRETDQLANELLQRFAKASVRLEKTVVSEAGASVYSASEYASQELPDLDVSLRGAVSIARRLQDPLAELVKIEPKSIGVGQYQHDVGQTDLARSLDAVVEDCVNAVGVDVNTASVPLLTRVSGLTVSTARAIVQTREKSGAFACRNDLRKVTGLGPKTFEQCAGFLRIRGGSNPLDMTGVHPESYPVVEKMVAVVRRPIAEIMGRAEVLQTLQPAQFAQAGAGLETVKDILRELEKPGRDPRPDFKVARFNEGVNDIADLRPGMVLEGTITNVAAFGAFVDVGAHQDGLVHVSQMAHRFIKEASQVVKTGDVVKVRVVEVDLARKRIALTMRLDEATSASGGTSPGKTQGLRGPGSAKQERNLPRNYRDAPQPAESAMAAAFAKLKR